MTGLVVENTLPKDWETIRFRYVANTTKGKLPEKSEEEPSSNLGGVPYLSMEYLRGESVPTEFVFPNSMITADAGDILLLWDGSNAGEFLQAKFGAVSSTAALLLPIKFQGRYLYWLCKGIEPILKTFTNGMGIPHVDGEFLKNLRLPFPTNKNFQQAIADYLDRETAHIDALIAEKERMLALLEEKRAALISQAVTRGLDPDAPLKSSGLDWLGDIPAHWETTKFNWNIYIIEGQVDPESEPYSSMMLVAPNHIESGTGRLIGRETASEQGAISGKYLCQKGDVIYSKIRPALRKVILAGEDCLCSADMYPLRPSDKLMAEYLLFLLLSDEYSTWAVLESERVAMPKINRETLTTLRLPLPPIPEQVRIIKHIHSESKFIDEYASEVMRSINLLKERRSALITAAVTGQIPPEEMAA